MKSSGYTTGFDVTGRVDSDGRKGLEAPTTTLVDSSARLNGRNYLTGINGGVGTWDCEPARPAPCVMRVRPSAAGLRRS